MAIWGDAFALLDSFEQIRLLRHRFRLFGRWRFAC